MAETKCTPAIRFNGFSNEWHIEKFESLTKVNQGLQIAISQRYTEEIDGGYFYITNEFLKESSNSKYYILNPPESVLCNHDDVLMTRTGNTGVVVTNISGAFHNNFFKIKFDHEKIEKKFLVTFLRLPKTQKIILASAGASTIPDLNHSAFYNIEIIYPALKEQGLLGEYFQNLDKLISLHQARVNKLVKLKKAMLEKMFPKDGADVPELRFKGFERTWEEKALGDISKMNSGGTPASSVKEFYTGPIPWVSISDMTEQGKFIKSSERTISEAGLKNSSARLFPKNTILYAMYASIGECSIALESVSTSQAILGIQPSDDLCTEYLYIYLTNLKEKIKLQGQQGSQANLNKGMVENFIISLPCFAEQVQIGNYFSNLDKLITLHQTELEKLNNLKKACLEKMFV